MTAHDSMWKRWLFGYVGYCGPSWLAFIACGKVRQISGPLLSWNLWSGDRWLIPNVPNRKMNGPNCTRTGLLVGLYSQIIFDGLNQYGFRDYRPVLLRARLVHEIWEEKRWDFIRNFTFKVREFTSYLIYLRVIIFLITFLSITCEFSYVRNKIHNTFWLFIDNCIDNEITNKGNL